MNWEINKHYVNFILFYFEVLYFFSHCLLQELDEYVDAENLKIFLNHSTQPLMSHGTFESIAALDIAEQITYLDHQIIMGISSEWVFKISGSKHVKYLDSCTCNTIAEK